MFEILIDIANNPDKNPERFIKFMVSLRPKGKNKNIKINKTLEALIKTLENDNYIREGLKKYISEVFEKISFSTVITETGLIKNQSFYTELKKRITNKILPNQPNENSLSYLIGNIFYKSDDYLWINSIEYSVWEKLFILLDFKPLSEKDNNDFEVKEVLTAIEILALRISGMGVDEDLINMVPEYNKLESPFISLSKEAQTLMGNLSSEGSDRSTESIDIRQMFVILEQCEVYIEKVVKNRERFGITFETTVKVARLNQEIERLKMALNFLSIDKEERRFGETIDFIKKIIELNCTKNNISDFINYSTGLVAYQITQHTGKTGEHYITSDKKEYFKMLFSASGGGVIVAVLCLIKVILSYQETSPLGTAFLYSMNYSIGFIIIYLMGFTLATKQPAMTAVTLAKTLDNNKKTGDYQDFTNLFTKLFRSQFIAFVGNVFLAFPTAIILGMLYIKHYGHSPADPIKASKLLLDINPFLSLALFHAAIAGFYLFLSGLISGYYMNNNIHHKISYRFRKHPLLNSIFPSKILHKIADFYDRNIGGISGNFWFGVFLGSTGTIGYFIGLPIDIRHITFAAGNFALSLIGLDFNVSFYDVFVSILCIGFIGFFNFIVSFMLSLTLAMRSRKIPLINIADMLIAIWKSYRLNPDSFWYPVENENISKNREEEDIK